MESAECSMRLLKLFAVATILTFVCINVSPRASVIDRLRSKRQALRDNDVDDAMQDTCGNRCNTWERARCNCDAKCSIYDDCCPDHEDSCTAEIAALQNTDPDSCQGRCGMAHSEMEEMHHHCHCDVYCFIRHDCCYTDIYEQCFPSLALKQDGLDTCAYRCSEHYGDILPPHTCHCSPECVLHQDCCEDYRGICNHTGFISCANRCGDGFLRGLTEGCFCDDDCETFNDCCMDLADECPQAQMANQVENPGVENAQLGNIDVLGEAVAAGMDDGEVLGDAVAGEMGHEGMVGDAVAGGMMEEGVLGDAVAAGMEEEGVVGDAIAAGMGDEGDMEAAGILGDPVAAGGEIAIAGNMASCRGRCGAGYGAECACDSYCGHISHQRCCDDYQELCGSSYYYAGGFTGMCEGHCGTSFDVLCDCDAHCGHGQEHLPCCPDFYTACAAYTNFYK